MSDAAPIPNRLIDKVKETVAQRGQSYDNPTADFVRIAIRWSLHKRTVVTPWDVALMMRDLKHSRASHSPDNPDHLLDVMGYADCEDMIHREFRENDEYREAWEAVEKALRLLFAGNFV